MHSRFKSLAGYGEEELERLENSTAAVVGLGATGSVIAEHLAKHGVNLVLVDRDYLEENDLYSSNIYTGYQCQKALPKAEAASNRLEELTEIEASVKSLGPGNTGMLDQADIVMDGTDNLETRFLIDEYCRKNGTPWIYSAALGEKGFSMFFQEECFNCLIEEVRPGKMETCESRGIMREVSGSIASISAHKAVRFLSGKEVEEKLENSRGESFGAKSEGCEVCQNHNFRKMEGEKTNYSVCGENKFELRREIGEVAFRSLKDSSDSYVENEYLVRAEIDGKSFTLFRSGRAIIEANDEGHAEALFSEIIGV